MVTGKQGRFRIDSGFAGDVHRDEQNVTNLIADFLLVDAAGCQLGLKLGGFLMQLVAQLAKFRPVEANPRRAFLQFQRPQHR